MDDLTPMAAAKKSRGLFSLLALALASGLTNTGAYCFEPIHEHGDFPALEQPRKKTPAKGSSKIALKRAAKKTFLAQTCAEANRIQRERQHKRELARWFAEDLNPEEQAFARANGLDDLPKDDHSYAPGVVSVETHEIDPHDSETCGTHNGAPIIRISESTFDSAPPAAEIEHLSHEEIADAGAAFETGLRWSLDGKDLVEMGKRALVMIASLRPCLTEGLAIDAALAAEFALRVRAGHRAAGILFGRAFERIRSASTLSGCGQQLYVVAYVLRPGFIDSSTLEAIGRLNGKTRQALSKNINALRDAFSGLKARTMRGDITRTRCQASQLSRA